MKENHEKEEWGAWEIVSDMLDNRDANGVYPTSECYQKLYEFVCSQKQQLLERLEEETNLNLESYLYQAKKIRGKDDELFELTSLVAEQMISRFKALIQEEKERL